jgi:uncharacterized protein
MTVHPDLTDAGEVIPKSQDAIGDEEQSHSGSDPAWLNQRDFFSRIIGAVASDLDKLLGYEDAAAVVTLAGSRIASDLSAAYAGRIAAAPSKVEGIAAALIDLKSKVGGNFSVETIADDRVVLVNSVCPFAQNVAGKPSLCMMTTNVFGRIAADTSGFARVEISEALSLGDHRCRVVIDLDRKGIGSGYRFER